MSLSNLNSSPSAPRAPLPSAPASSAAASNSAASPKLNRKQRRAQQFHQQSSSAPRASRGTANNFFGTSQIWEKVMGVALAVVDLFSNGKTNNFVDQIRAKIQAHKHDFKKVVEEIEDTANLATRVVGAVQNAFAALGDLGNAFGSIFAPR